MLWFNDEKWWSFCYSNFSRRANLHRLELLMLLQKINILIVNQSVIDLCGASFALIVALVEVDGTRMSHDSIYDQFICRIWLTRIPLWCLLVTSSYGILLTAVERYVAVIYPFWYKVVAAAFGSDFRVGTGSLGGQFCHASVSTRPNSNGNQQAYIVIERLH